MQGSKGALVVVTLVAAVIALGACRKEVHEESLKLGASDVSVAIVR
jgi:hypothetical protein